MTTLSKNKNATFNYEILETFEAGISLFGTEVKAIRSGKVTLAGSYVTLKDDTATLVGATITPYQEKNVADSYQPARPRQLLLKKQELARLTRHLNTQGLTIVPLRLYNTRGKIKLEIALVRGKKKTDKRQVIQDREQKRSIERTLKRGSAE